MSKGYKFKNKDTLGKWDLLNKLSKNSKETVQKYYDQNDFFTKMEELI